MKGAYLALIFMMILLYTSYSLSETETKKNKNSLSKIKKLHQKKLISNLHKITKIKKRDPGADAGFVLAEQPGINCAIKLDGDDDDGNKPGKPKTPAEKDAEDDKKKHDENPANGGAEGKPACTVVKEGQELDGRYQILNFSAQDKRNGAYQRWLAKDLQAVGREGMDPLVILKVYIKKNGELVKNGDENPNPAKECQQVKWLEELNHKNKDSLVEIEKCVTPEAQSKAQDVPMYNIFKRANGENLHELCIHHDCRKSIKSMARGIMQGLDILNKGPSYFFKQQNMNARNIFYSAKTGKTTLTNYEYSEFLSEKMDVAGDLKIIGRILTIMMADDPKFSVNVESALDFYSYMHTLPAYANFDDADIGVSPKLKTNPAITEYTEDKENTLKDSLYDFILRCVGTNKLKQFSSIGEALTHPFLAKGKVGQLTPNSDYRFKSRHPKHKK